jgi:hypothetical protein
VVERDSAVLGLPGEREIKYAMHADHSNICKFADEDGQDYRPVWQEVQALVEDAVLAVENAERLQSLVPPNTEGGVQSIISE